MVRGDVQGYYYLSKKVLLLFGLLPPNRGVAKQIWEYRKELNAIHQILKGNPNLLWHILLGFGWVSYCGFASLTTWSKILWKCLSWLSGQLLWTRFNHLKTRLIQYLDDYCRISTIKSLNKKIANWFQINFRECQSVLVVVWLRAF